MRTLMQFNSTSSIAAVLLRSHDSKGQQESAGFRTWRSIMIEVSIESMYVAVFSNAVTHPLPFP